MKKENEPLLVKEYLGRGYDSVEFPLVSSMYDYDIRANVSGAFSSFGVYTTINIRTDQTITIKLNSVDNDLITINPNSPFELDNLLEVTDVFITNISGSTANIKMIATRKGA